MSQHDFDFLFGSWRIANRRLRNAADREHPEWTTFEATSEARPILGGLGNVDTFSAADVPGRGPLEGFTFRLYEPDTGVWRIWWASSTYPGVLDVPVEGRFDGPHGVFECDDTLNGEPIRVRYDWFRDDPDKPRWQQSFSWDGGTTWEPNWFMDSTRVV
jgi:hypothetical protein